MNQSVFEACLPWAVCVIVAVIGARILITLSGAKLNVARLKSIHRCQEGSVQSLSFVLTLPFFVMILMMIIQASHIMIGNIVVNYSAFAAVRSASVWIPTNTNEYETTNRIGSISQINSSFDGEQYLIAPVGEKFSKIQQAATLACMTLGPSRDMGYQLASADQPTHGALVQLFRGLDPDSESSGLISQRLYNKLAYSYPNTNVRLTFWHRNTIVGLYFQDPPLQVNYDVPPHIDEYYLNEVGWQDELTAQVTYNLPLLPGPVRFFANQATSDQSNSSVDASGNTYIWPITASATMGIEGEKPLMSYWQEEF